MMMCPVTGNKERGYPEEMLELASFLPMYNGLNGWSPAYLLDSDVISTPPFIRISSSALHY